MLCDLERRVEVCERHWKIYTTGISAECESKLTAMLSDEEKHTLSVLISAQQEIDGITAIENFISGFRLGVRLMVECMDDDDGNIKDGR